MTREYLTKRMKTVVSGLAAFSLFATSSAALAQSAFVSVAQSSFQSEMSVTAQISRKVTQDNAARQAAYMLAALATQPGGGVTFLAPQPGYTGSLPASGVGTVPSGINAPTTEGYGVNLGYCAWNTSASGGYLSNAGASTPLAMAVISPGANSKIETTCDSTGVHKPSTSDDYVFTYTASQLAAGVQSTTPSAFGAPWTGTVLAANAAMNAASAAGAAAPDGQVRLFSAAGNQLYRWNATGAYVGTWTSVAGGSSQWTSTPNGANTDLSYGLGNVSVGKALTVTGQLTANGGISATPSSFGGATIGFQFVNAAGATAYYRIASLPASSSGTYDHINMEVVLNGNWASNANVREKLLFANRNSFTARYTQEGGVSTPNVKIVAYTESDGSVSIYAVLMGGAYTTVSGSITSSIGAYSNANPAVQGSSSVTGTLAFDTSTATPATTLDASGNFGIGGAAPAGVRLAVMDSQANAAIMSLTNTAANSSSLAFYAAGPTGYGITGWAGNSIIEASSGNGGLVMSAYSGPLILQTNGRTERMRVSAAGYVGINNSNPTYHLDVGGSIRSVGGEVDSGYGIRILNAAQNGGGSITANTGSSGGIQIGSDAGPLQFNTNGVVRGQFSQSGALLIGEQVQTNYGGSAPLMEVFGPNIATTDGDGGTMALIGNSNTAGSGGALAFGSQYNGAGNNGTFARIGGAKDNATSGQYGGALVLSTRANGSAMTERMRIDSAGNVGIGGAPSARLSIITTNNGNFNNTTAWNSGTVAIGPNAGSGSGAALGFSYDTTGDIANIMSLAPGVAWKPLNINSSTTNFYSGGTSVAAIGAAGMTISGNGNIVVGPNSTWGASLTLGGNGRINTATASVVTTNGNLHLDAANGHDLYLNYYNTGGNLYGPGNSTILTSANIGTYAPSLTASNSFYGANYFLSNKGASSTVGANNTYGLEASSTDGGAAGMSFHRQGNYAVNMGLDPDNVLRIGGWSAPANRWQLDMSGNMQNAGNITAGGTVTSNGEFINAGETNRLNLWDTSGNYSIGMGQTAALFQYGTVTDYSIKTQMDSGSPGRGFVWGQNGVKPIASLNAASGNMQIAGTFASGDITTTRGNTTGVIFLGNTGSRYLYYDGTNYQLPNANLYVNGALSITTSNIGTYVPTLAANNVWTGLDYFLSNKGASSYNGTNNTYSLSPYSTDGGSASMSFLRAGAYGTNLGLDPDNVIRLGGWSGMANAWTLNPSNGNMTNAGAFTAAGNISTPGYVYSQYLNQSSPAGEVAGANVTQFMVQSGTDGFLRKSTPAQAATALNPYFASLSANNTFTGTNTFNGNFSQPTVGATFTMSGISTMSVGTVNMQNFSTNLSSNTIGAAGTSTVTVSLQVNGKAQATGGFYTASDIRLKHDIRTMTGAELLPNFMKLRSVNYVMNTDPDSHRTLGYIAQEIQTLFPEMVADGGNGYLAVGYSEMIPIVTAVVQKHELQIEDLQAHKLDNLVGKWSTSSEGKERFFFEQGGRTILRGHGDIALDIHNAQDASIADFKANGDMDLTGVLNFTGTRGGFAFNPTGTLVSSLNPGEIIINTTNAMRAAVRLQYGAPGTQLASAQVFGMLFGDSTGVGLADGTGKSILTASTNANGVSTVTVSGTLAVGGPNGSSITMAGSTGLSASGDGSIEVDAANGVRIYNPQTKETVISLGGDGTVQARRFVPTDVVVQNTTCDTAIVGAISRDTNGQPMVCTK